MRPTTTKTALNYPKFAVNHKIQQRCSTIETAGRNVELKITNNYDKTKQSANQTHCQNGITNHPHISIFIFYRLIHHLPKAAGTYSLRQVGQRAGIVNKSPPF